MAAVVIDTHTAVWYLSNDPKLSENAKRALDDAAATGDPTYLCAISIVEVVYLVEKGKLPATMLDRLIGALSDPDSAFVIAPLDKSVALALRQIPRSLVPDMPDRIIAATAHHLNLPLVTRDTEITNAGINTIW